MLFSKGALRRKLSRSREEVKLHALLPVSNLSGKDLARRKHAKPSSMIDLPQDSFSFGSSMHAGARREDCIIEQTTVGNSNVTLFGVVDGHGGDACSKFVTSELPKAINERVLTSSCDPERLLLESWGGALESAFDDVARKWDSLDIKCSGAVASIVLVSGRNCLIAHAGDCKIVASSGGDSFVELTRDHRCSDPDEAERVEGAGGVIFNGRVEGRLLPSRVFGDVDVRSMRDGQVLDCVSPIPEISFHSFDEKEDAFMVLASDGLFDTVPIQRVISLVRQHLRESGTANSAAELLTSLAAKRSNDDISVIVLHFKRSA